MSVMGSTVFYALTRDTQPGTLVWFPGDLEEVEGCPKCKNESVRYYLDSWVLLLSLQADGIPTGRATIKFCPFCGYDLSEAVHKVGGTLKEWTGPQDTISPHKHAVVILEDGTERTISINRAG